MTNTGTLTDFEGDVARISDKPLKMLPAAAKWCKDRLRKGMFVDYDLVADGEKKGYILKMWERKPGAVTDIAGDAVEKAQEKMAKAGFGQPAAGNTITDCTSTNAPAGEFWNVPGVVESIDAPNRKATVSDEAGIIHPLTWAAGYLDEKFGKLKPGYFRKFSGEAKVPDVVTAVGWMGKDEPEWVKARYKALHPQGGGGGWKGQPRNDKAITLQCCLKVAADVLIARGFCEDNDPPFEEQMDRITAAAIKAAGELCKAGGVQ